MYKFMQIYGSCVDLFITGENLIKGPVDNVLTKNKDVIKLLLNDKYLSYIKTTKFTQTERPIGFPGDSPVAYDTPLIRIVHNNPLLESYTKRTEERCKNLKEFLSQVRTNKNYFLLYSLNSFDINRKTHKLKNKVFIENVEYLKTVGLLDKIIFVGTVGTCWTDFWSNDIIPVIKKYNLKYIEISGIKSWINSTKEDLATLHNCFIDEVNYVLKNGTNSRYLQKRDENGAYIKEESKVAKSKETAENKENKNTYLNNGYFGL